MKQLITFSLLVLLTSCGGNVSRIPEGVEYQIAKEETDPAFNKSNIYIRLNKKVDEQVLTAIAEEVRSKRTDVEKIWIFFFLPDMPTDAGAWATTHFTPDLEVKILGSTEEEDARLGAVTIEKGEIIGKWKDNSPMRESSIIVYKGGNRLKMKTTYKDGSSSDHIIIEKKEAGKIRYDFEDPNSFGEYYMVEGNGNLGMYDSDGKIGEAEKVN